MEIEELKKYLESVWEDGFLYKLRYGTLDMPLFIEFNKVLESTDSIIYDDKIDCRLVSLLWIIPQFILWQKEFLLKKNCGEDNFNKVLNSLSNQCERLLGMP